VPPTPLFLTGTARSGLTLVARTLSGTDYVELAIDALLPLFRSLRLAMLRAAGFPAADEPIQDYYFGDERIRRLDAVLAGSLDVPIDQEEWAALRVAVACRAADEAPDLVPHLETLEAATYGGLLGGLLELVVEVRGAAGARHVGFKDVWTIEFVPALARAYPESRFVVMQRDPRAIVASIVALGREDQTQLGHPLSYARHWRKQVALAHRYRADPLLADRVHVLGYERLVEDPERELGELCRFLGIPFAQAMLDTGGWPGNSSFGPNVGIDTRPVERWRTELDPPLLKLVELVCGVEMQTLGYAPETAGGPDEEILTHLVESDAWPVSWRSDLGDPRRDYELELARRELLDRAGEVGEVRRAFLFEDVHRALRQSVAAMT
jgi:hypothetical protein